MGFKIRQPDEKLRNVVGEQQSAVGYFRRQKISNAAIGTNVYVHAAITLLTTVQDITPTTQPDVARIVSITGTKAGGSLTGNVVITGTNIRGEVITDTIAINTNDSEVFGVKAFKTITNIRVPVRVTSADTVKIGVGDALGLDRCMEGDEVIYATFGGVYETTRPTVVADDNEVEKNTVNPNGTLNGSADLVVGFISTELAHSNKTSA
jgi:hypothetical protein